VAIFHQCSLSPTEADTLVRLHQLKPGHCEPCSGAAIQGGTRDALDCSASPAMTKEEVILKQVQDDGEIDAG
jgi:hypothetical protein